MSIPRPTVYPLWTDGNSTKVTQPPSVQQLSGWTPGEPPPPDYLNWLQWMNGLWIAYLDNTLNGDATGLNLDQTMRLINGGSWSWNATTGVLTWASSFNLAIPSIPDSQNQVSASTATIADGSVAYVTANIPFNTTGNITSGSNQLTEIPEAGPIATGQTITGSGIPSSTTITAGPTLQADGTYTCTLSANATASATAESVTIVGSSTPTVSVAASSSLLPNANTVIIARRVGSGLILGVNSGQTILRDGESKPLLALGYLGWFTATAGENLSQGQAVYVTNGESGRTTGTVWRTDCGITNGAIRSFAAGFVATAVSASGSALIITGGQVPLFTSLAYATAYYLNPSVLGGVTATKPTTSGQFLVPVGIAISATGLNIVPGFGSYATPISTPSDYPNYFCASESDLTTAISSATSNGGGVICLLNSFTVASAHTIPSGTVLIGRKGGAIITLTSSGAITLSDNVKVQDVWLNTALTAGNMIIIPSNVCEVLGCQFNTPPASSGSCVYITGNGNTSRSCIFIGVAGETATGINYAAGVDNAEYDNTYEA